MVAYSAMLAITIFCGESHEDLYGEEEKYGFGRLIDLARAEPVAVAKHGRPVVVVSTQ